MLTSIQCVFSWLWGCEGSGAIFIVCACAVGLCGNGLPGMRGTWGVVWRSAHVPMIPFTWLRRANAWTPSAHASNYQALLSIKTMQTIQIQLLCACVLYSYGVTWILWPYMGIVTSPKSHGWNARFWLVESKFPALWLVTDYCSHVYYSWLLFQKKYLFLTFNLNDKQRQKR